MVKRVVKLELLLLVSLCLLTFVDAGGVFGGAKSGDAADEETAGHGTDLRKLEGELSTAIVGGKKVPLDSEEFRWMASLQRGTTDFPFCGGSLIHANWVLTAGHCVKNEAPDRIQIGNYDLSDESGGDIRTVSEVVRHPEYSGVTNDIALLRLSAPVRDIEPLFLSDELFGPPEAVGDLVTAIGWGYTKYNGGSVQDRLREVQVPVQSQNSCSEVYGGIDETKVCAGFRAGGKDSCSGDSGGPLVGTDPDTGTQVQIGIVSYGDGCAKPNAFGVYARVSAFSEFISATLESYGDELQVLTARPTAAPTARPTVFTPGTPEEKEEFQFCKKAKTFSACANRPGRCFWNDKDGLPAEAFAPKACLPKFLDPTRVRTESPTDIPTAEPSAAPTQAPTDEVAKQSAEEMQEELRFCNVKNANACNSDNKKDRCFWNRKLKKGGLFKVGYLSNECLPNFFKTVFD